MSYDNSGGSNNLNRSSGVIGNIIMAWVKMVNYADQDLLLQTSGSADGYEVGNFGAATTLFNQTNGFNTVNHNILTGSNTSWVFVCTVVTINTKITVYTRLPGVATLTTTTLTDADQFGLSSVQLMSLIGGGAFHCRLGPYKEWQNTADLTPAQILAESAQSAPIVTTNLNNYLPCTTGFAVGTDQSAAALNWTVTGTITINADNPVMALPGGPARSAVFLNTD